jgi:hypothetical protein
MKGRDIGKCIAVLFLVSISLIEISMFNANISVNAEYILYTFVISDWYRWVIGVNISVPKICEVGSYINLIASIKVFERGEGTRLVITKLEASISNVTVSRYVGNFHNEGEAIYGISLKIPLTSSKYSSMPPSTIGNDNVSILLQGYVENVNGNRNEVRYNYSIPILLITSPSILMVYIDSMSMNPGHILTIEVKNFDILPLHKVSLALYINSEIYKVYNVDVIQPNESRTLREFLNLEPGIHTVTIKTNFTTSYGMNRQHVVSTHIIVKSEPRIRINTNTSSTLFSMPIGIKGYIEPRDIYGVILEYSLNGIEWATIASIESNNSGIFTYIWRPIVAGSIFLRARTFETELYREGKSNEVVLNIERVKPKIVISPNKTELNVGDSTKISVRVEPPMRINVKMLYRVSEEDRWNTYTAFSIDETGSASIPTQFFTKPGRYIFKAVVDETNTTRYSESNEATITVKAATPKTETSVPYQEPFEQQRFRNILIISIALAALVAALLLFIGRRRP